VALLVAPLLAVVLTIAAHVGAVARNDLQTLTVKRYGRRVGAILLVSVVVVNVVTIAADLQAGARDPSVSPMSTLMPATNRTVPCERRAERFSTSRNRARSTVAATFWPQLSFTETEQSGVGDSHLASTLL
jgi:hypothetical protein